VPPPSTFLGCKLFPHLTLGNAFVFFRQQPAPAKHRELRLRAPGRPGTRTKGREQEQRATAREHYNDTDCADVWSIRHTTRVRGNEEYVCPQVMNAYIKFVFKSCRYCTQFKPHVVMLITCRKINDGDERYKRCRTEQWGGGVFLRLKISETKHNNCAFEFSLLRTITWYIPYLKKNLWHHSQRIRAAARETISIVVESLRMYFIVKCSAVWHESRNEQWNRTGPCTFVRCSALGKKGCRQILTRRSFKVKKTFKI